MVIGPATGMRETPVSILAWRRASSMGVVPMRGSVGLVVGFSVVFVGTKLLVSSSCDVWFEGLGWLGVSMVS